MPSMLRVRVLLLLLLLSGAVLAPSAAPPGASPGPASGGLASVRLASPQLQAPTPWQPEPDPVPPPPGAPGLPARPFAALAGAARPLVCVLDTGVDASHADLDDGKVVAWKDFVRGRAEPYDDSGHGTHVAALAAGDGDGVRAGTAPEARLAVGKVMDGKGQGTSRWAVQGIDWCVAQGARVINLSLEEDPCTGRQGLREAVERALRQGTLVVTAAGNRGDAPCAIHTPGSLPTVLTVGALGGPAWSAGSIAGFSGRGPSEGPVKPDVVAPGARIVSAGANTRDGARTMDGTSMAAPQVAGIVALLAAAHPDVPPLTLAEAVRSAARDGGPPGPDRAWGWGVVDAEAALAWLDARAAARAGPGEVPPTLQPAEATAPVAPAMPVGA